MPEKFDLIIAGAGIAGLSAALEASKHRDRSVAVLDRFDGTHSNTYFAQGGIACAVGKSDSWEKHAQDTLRAGCGLSDAGIVELVAKKGPGAVKELMDLGLEFDGGNAKPELGLEGGHSEKRVLHIRGDQTGMEMELFMRKVVGEQENVSFLKSTFLREILVGKGAYSGMVLVSGETELMSGSAVLATGGYAACFEKTTNPETTLGSGIAIAGRAGCALEGMEFVQFHPTTLRADVGGNYLVSEAVRGEGGKIVNENGKTIVDPLGTRDKVSIAIYNEISRGGKVFLDARELKSDFAARFPVVYRELLKKKISPEKDLIPIETAAHYTIGGVKTDLRAATNIKGVYAAGECACSGLHGANRLASNSLLEGLVMGRIAGANAASEKAARQVFARTGSHGMSAPVEKDGVPTRTVLAAMKKTMWRCCGVVRDERNLLDGFAGIRSLEEKANIRDTIESIEARNALVVCRKTIESALARKESIGVHYRLN